MQRILSLCFSVFVLCFPLQVGAAGVAAHTTTPILITEVQAGTSASASQEFIELYNRSPQAIVLSTMQLQLEIASSTATDWSHAKKVALSGTFYPGTYLLVASNYVASGDSKPYLAQYASASFASGLTYQAGHIRLTAIDTGGVRQTLDSVEWTTHASDGTRITEPIESAKPFDLEAALEPGQSLKRLVDSHGFFVATGDVSHDFGVSSCPSPTATNRSDQAWQPDASQASPDYIATTIDIDNPLCVTISDGENTDDDTLGQSTEDPPAVLIPSETPIAAQPQPKGIPASDRGLKSPQISEILPNPAKPQTDADDEFIELYNSNQVSFDLSGFQLVVGASKTKAYTFPDGATLLPGGFKAYFSSDTHLSLSNSGGQVQLLDPSGVILDKTDAYGTAKEGQSWIRAAGVWQWTTAPTPGATNVIKAPAVKAKKQTAKKTAVAAKKASTARKASTSQNLASATPISEVHSSSPLHGSVLAVMGGFALLYGAYEYRRDVANKIYQLRAYREARRESRRAAARRRGS